MKSQNRKLNQSIVKISREAAINTQDYAHQVWGQLVNEAKQEQKEKYERNKFNLRERIKRLKRLLKAHFSGNFGYPKDSDFRKLCLNIHNGKIDKCRQFILQFCYNSSNVPNKINKSLEKINPLNFRSEFDGRNMLLLAAEHESRAHYTIAEMFLQEGIDYTCTDNFGRSVLHICSISGASLIAEAVLLRQNVNIPIDLDTKDRQGLTALMYASQSGFDDIVQILLEYGASLADKSSFQHWTALHFAASEGNMEIVKLLLKAGANLKAHTRLRESPEDIALANNQREVAIWLHTVVHDRSGVAALSL